MISKFLRKFFLVNYTVTFIKAPHYIAERRQYPPDKIFEFVGKSKSDFVATNAYRKTINKTGLLH